MSATDGTSAKFPLFDRAAFAGAWLRDTCKTQFARFRTTQRVDPADTHQASATETILQHLTRVRLPSGKVQIRGAVMAEFATGDRQTSAYVGFCPPFETVPHVEATIVDDIEAEIKLAQLLHNGVQFEIRLSESAEEPIRLQIDFCATETTVAVAGTAGAS